MEYLFDLSIEFRDCFFFLLQKKEKKKKQQNTGKRNKKWSEDP